MSQDLLAAFGWSPAEDQSGTSESRSINDIATLSLFNELNGGNASAAGLLHTATKNAPLHDERSAQDNTNDEDWGEFEGSTEVATHADAMPEFRVKAQPNLPAATQFSRWLDEEDDGFKDYSEPAPRSKKWDFTKPEPPAITAKSKSRARDPDVLFDVDDEPVDEDEDDEFGDFEDAGGSGDFSSPQRRSANTVQDLLGTELTAKSVQRSEPSRTAAHTSKPPAKTSLLDLGDLNINDSFTKQWSTSKPKTTAPSYETLGTLSRPSPPAKLAIKATRTERSRSFDQELSKQAPSAKQRTVLRKAHVPLPVATQEEDSELWDDFEAWEQSSPAPAPALPPTPGTTHQQPTSTFIIPPPLTSDAAESAISLPPTNIPPPALVLSLFAPLFTSAESLFFAPLRRAHLSVQTAIYTDPKTTVYLRGLLALATVCGRIIAARKLRWKRDTILAQSMRIGPSSSSSGTTSGLKLTSLDRGEIAKEDRETADAVRAWQTTVGKLKSALAKLHQLTAAESKSLGPIPELKESIPVRSEGQLKGNRACALCGLKREERVRGVDFEVEDSFGEWWVENVSMHRACRNFWEQHRDTLRSR